MHILIMYRLISVSYTHLDVYKRQQVGGAIMPDTYDWIEEQLEDAWDNEMIVLPFAHHNLLDQSEVYVQDCTIEHSSQLIDILQGWDISLFLSGHLHVQHMDETKGSGTIREIVTKMCIRDRE